MSGISFTLPTPPSTNALFKNIRGRGRVKTDTYKAFIACALASLLQQRVEAVKGHVVLVIGVERVSKAADIDNRLKALLDVMVKAQIIEDDRFVTALSISWLPKANKRRSGASLTGIESGLAHVTIYPVQHLSLNFHPAQNGACGGFYKISTTI